MKDKYSMSLEENIFVAKKLLISNIYNSARVEGCNVTFPQTQTILDGVNVADVTLDDIQTILNLRNAWKFMLSTITSEFNLEYVCRLNDDISRGESLAWGKLRTGQVGISGTDYIPDIPDYDTTDRELSSILISERYSCTEKAIKIFLYVTRHQLFWDGNKRTATLCANKILIKEGKGIFTIPDKHILEFNERLLEYYNTNDESKIFGFLFECCIDGMPDRQNQKHPDIRKGTSR